MPDPEKRIYALTESDDGGLLIAKLSGITKFRNGKTEAFPIPAGFQPYRLFRDRNGGLWIGDVVDRGLLHVHEGRRDTFSGTNGLSNESITAFLEDREGSIWVGTVDGLDRFREFAVSTVSVQQGLSSRGVFSILAARDGSLWFGMSNAVNRWKDGQITVYRKRSLRGPRTSFPGGSLSGGKVADSGRTVREVVAATVPDLSVECLFEDASGQIWVAASNGVALLRSERFVAVPSVPHRVVYSMTGDRAGNVWMAHQEALFRLFQASVVERVPWGKLGRREPATALLHDAVRDGLWLGFRDGGVAFFKDGQLRISYGGAEGLGKGMVRSFYADASGSIWAATDEGLSRIRDSRIVTLTSQNGLPCNTVHWMIEDDAHFVWVYTACGLVRIAKSELDAWVSHPKQAIRAEVFDSSDGVTSHRSIGGYGAVVAKAADGRLWFLRVGGVNVVDPRRLPFNKLPPPVHIESIEADGKHYDPRPGLALSARVRDLTIDFTALSLVAPEKMQFKYLLEHQDPGWKEGITQRRAHYTNLHPRKYVFRVLASNNSGVWNETGDTLEFSIDPAWNQTTWFYASCVAAFVAVLWGLYRLRLYQIQREFNAQLDGRVDERLRVARELHDTLLQTFQAGLIQMQAGYNLLTRRPEKAAEAIQGAITTSAGAIAEGRDAIQNMRSSTVEANDLARALRIAGDQMAAGGFATFDVRVQGSSRDLHPILRDDVYRIALEAMRNAFQHAEAKAIEAEIVYGENLRVRVRDNGKGIDPAVMEQGRRSGHYGIPGMRERAEHIGGKLDVWSGAGAGTEIQLSIPSNIAFGRPGGGSLLRRFGRKRPRSIADASP